jgi:hypothetical protein
MESEELLNKCAAKVKEPYFERHSVIGAGINVPSIEHLSDERTQLPRLGWLVCTLDSCFQQHNRTDASK